MITEEQFAMAMFEKRNRMVREPGFTLRVAGLQLFRVLPFYGAGWSWPYVLCKKWQIGFYFHCGRGLYVGFGWLAVNRQITRQLKRQIAAMTPKEREEFRVMLGQIE